MNEEGILKAIGIVESMNDATKRMEKALERNNSDSIIEIKKELIDLQKQLSALI